MRIVIFLLFSFCNYSASAEAIQNIENISSNKANLYVEVSGKSADKPLLLFLHGGPGDVEFGLLAFQSYMGDLLEEHFLVAYLHQRGAGKSSKVDDATLTIANHVEDVYQVTEYLRRKYKKDKIYLAGHSWGGALAALYAEKYENTVMKLILISTFQNTQKQIKASFEATLEWATNKEHSQAIKELSTYKRLLATKNDWLLLSKWSSQANGGIAKNFNFTEFIATNNLNLEYPNWQKRRNKIATVMQQEFDRISVEEKMTQISIPALFVAGKHDTITPIKLMKNDFDNYSGEKYFLLLENSHHLPFVDEPNILAQAMIAFLRNTEHSF